MDKIIPGSGMAAKSEGIIRARKKYNDAVIELASSGQEVPSFETWVASNYDVALNDEDSNPNDEEGEGR